MVKEKIKRETDQFFTVELDEDETAYMAGLMDDWATFPDICMPELYEELRDAVDDEMRVSRATANVIIGCLESEENWGLLYDKFAAVHRENPVLPS